VTCRGLLDWAGVVRGHRLFLLNHITFCGTYTIIAIKRFLGTVTQPLSI
jgi:hypothetical protein